ncbi:MAG: response regulator transcription factor [Nitrospiraceae bacterium]|nr:response regulator transcription factor [Nitrospiraceae bacterium]
MMNKILVVDDEADIVELISYNLKKEGYEVDTALDGDEALQKIRSGSNDLVVLDLMLPGIQGLEICRIIRSTKELATLPVIMLTAKSEEVDRIVGLEMGADDYVVKPFSPRELVARVKSLLRRAESGAVKEEDSKADAESNITIGDMVIDRERYTVTIGSKKIKLSAREFKLLAYLAQKRGRIYNREQLLDAVWGDDVFVEPRTVDVHIRRLRSKIEENPDNPVYIRTMRGVGYYIE